MNLLYVLINTNYLFINLLSASENQNNKNHNITKRLFVVERVLPDSDKILLATEQPSIDPNQSFVNLCLYYEQNLNKEYLNIVSDYIALNNRVLYLFSLIQYIPNEFFHSKYNKYIIKSMQLYELLEPNLNQIEINISDILNFEKIKKELQKSCNMFVDLRMIYRNAIIVKNKLEISKFKLDIEFNKIHMLLQLSDHLSKALLKSIELVGPIINKF